jgi:uncharacterized 2Fe-2S/4Fe-4S cluster protein (DUF4445 family)
VLAGHLPETDADRARLSQPERDAGWRLACQAQVTGDLTLDLRQWATPILADDTPFEFVPGSGLGIAIDMGTTTLVAQLVDLESGRVLGTQTALNPQARFGADIMSRIAAALEASGPALTEAVRERVWVMVERLLARHPTTELKRVAIVGNTAMEHLYLGYSVEPLSRYPFVPAHSGPTTVEGAAVGWRGQAARAHVHYLPSLGGFVGSDILGVMLATRFHEADGPVGLADLGTNGEIAVASAGRILVASTAAGPAFEGARISHGMRAAQGAIDRVEVASGAISAHVIGGGAARGICGSGLVGAVASGIALGQVSATGRLSHAPWLLTGDVSLTQRDIRELQLAKGAIAAGLRVLHASLDLDAAAVDRFYLAGAFGNNIDLDSALAIGLLPYPKAKIRPVGNAALLGAKLALFLEEGGHELWRQLLPRIEHVSLEKHPGFDDWFAEAMAFGEE